MVAELVFELIKRQHVVVLVCYTIFTIESVRGTSPMTTQQPTTRQGANAWKMGTPLDRPIFMMGFLFASLWEITT